MSRPHEGAALSSKEEIDISDKPYANFYRLRIVTMSTHPEFRYPVNVEALYYFLPMTWLRLKPNGNISEYKDTYPGYSGAIIEANHGNKRRGLKVRKSFQNATTISLSTSDKNIGMKVFSTNAHTFGAQSLASVEEAMETLFEMFIYCQYMSDKIKDKNEKTERTWEYVIRSTKGDKCNKPLETINAGNLSMVHMVEDHTVIMPEIFPLSEETIIYDKNNEPLDIDIELANYLLNIVPDYQSRGYHYSDLIEHFLYMRNSPRIIDQSPSLRVIRTSMINYTFDIGFNVKRVSLFRVFTEVPGFTAYYDNHDGGHLELTVDITNLVDQNPVLNCIIRNNKRRVVVVRINIPESGQVKLSGPCSTVNEYVYNSFMNIVTNPKVNSKIRKNKSAHVLRYYPEKILPLIAKRARREEIAVDNNIRRAGIMLKEIQREESERKEVERKEVEEANSRKMEDEKKDEKKKEQGVNKKDVGLMLKVMSP